MHAYMRVLGKVQVTINNRYGLSTLQLCSSTVSVHHLGIFGVWRTASGHVYGLIEPEYMMCCIRS
jgi:hypothetical protein